MRTNPYQADPYAESACVRTDHPTDDTMTLVRLAVQALRQIYKEGLVYQKAGVTLSNLVSNEGQQLSLFRSQEDDGKSKRMMMGLDQTNQKYGRGALFLAGEGTKKTWQIKAEYKTPQYTTNWDELAIVHAR